MADVTEVLEVRLGDATTASQRAKVDSSGNQYNVITTLPALVAGAATIGNVGLVAGVATIGSIANTGFNVTSSIPTGANTIGAVNINGTIPISYAGTMAVSGSVGVNNFPATQNVAITSGSIANTAFGITGAIPAGTNVIGHIIADSGSTTAVTSLPAIPAGTNVIGHVIADSGSTTAVTSLPAIPTGANTIGAVGLNAGSNIVGNFRIDQTTLGTTNGVQIVGPGTSLANPLYVSSEEGTAVTVKTSTVTSASLAAGSSVTVSAAFITSGKQGYLRHVTASSSVAVKIELQSINNSSVATSQVVMFNSNYNLSLNWEEYWNGEFAAQAAANGTTNCFAIKFTNMDNQSNAADVYATLVWTES